MSRPKSITAVQRAAPDWVWEATAAGKYRCRHTVHGALMIVDASRTSRGGQWSVMATEMAREDSDPCKPVECVGDAGWNLPAAILRAAHRLADRVTRRDAEVKP